jgi:restriction system protein
MRTYYRIMLGAKSMHAAECFAGNFIGADYGITEDLTGKLPEAWKDFNAAFIPVFMAAHPEKTKVGAGLACGMLWTVAKGLQTGDRLLSPDGAGQYHVAEITGDYYHAPGDNLPHRRPATWLPNTIARTDMSEGLKNSSGSVGTVCNLSKTGHAEEVERLIGGIPTPIATTTEGPVEDLAVFAMEKHLEDFLVKNWAQTDLGQEFDIYQEDGLLVGQQYLTDSGPLDVLAVSKDKKKLLVVELKRGRASDTVVGQILRYMGYVKEELAEPGQEVVGAIIALEDDLKMRRALTMVPILSFYRYKIDFHLVKG